MNEVLMDSSTDTLDDGLMTTAEVCAFLKIGRTKAYELMARGELPSTMIGCQRRIPRRAVIDLAARRYVPQLGAAS